jgi:hypothetical protein
LIHCIATSAGVFSNRDKLFLGSSDRLSLRSCVLGDIWSGCGPKLGGNPRLSTHSAVTVECCLQQSVDLARFQPRVRACEVRNRRCSGQDLFGKYDDPASAWSPRVLGVHLSTRITANLLRFWGELCNRPVFVGQRGATETISPPHEAYPYL